MTISSIIHNHPRLPRLMVTRCLALSFVLSGCVPATQYEQASSAAEVEAEGHRRIARRLSAAEDELQRVKADNEKLSAAQAALTTQLSKEEVRLAQTSMDMESTKKEHEQQLQLVTQLRGELARVGDHLKIYQGDKDELTVKLATAEGQVKELEARVADLSAKAESSEQAQAQLRGALQDLEELKAVDDEALPEEESPDEESSAEEASDASAATPADEASEKPPEADSAEADPSEADPSDADSSEAGPSDADSSDGEVQPTN